MISERIEADIQETSRTYYYPDGAAVTLRKPINLRVNPSGKHYVKTSDGHLHIIAPGWVHIEIVAPSGEWIDRDKK